MSNEKLLINDGKSNNFEIKSNKKIEEMAKIVEQIVPKYIANEIAYLLYNAGYRKQSEGEWIITTPIVMRVWDSDCITCSVCGGKSVGLLEDNKLKYCPHCGARMKEE